MNKYIYNKKEIYMLKECIKCHKDKEAAEFGYNGMTADKLNMMCPDCRRGNVAEVVAPVVKPVVEPVAAPVVEPVVDPTTAPVEAASEIAPVEPIK
jgi:hypothetical protein